VICTGDTFKTTLIILSGFFVRIYAWFRVTEFKSVDTIVKSDCASFGEMQFDTVVVSCIVDVVTMQRVDSTIVVVPLSEYFPTGERA
jgi:hypothetical protein